MNAAPGDNRVVRFARVKDYRGKLKKVKVHFT